MPFPVVRLECATPGCKNKRMQDGHGSYKDHCTSCHRRLYGYYTTKNAKAKLADSLNLWECQLCHWKGPCDKHRLFHGKAGGLYNKKNVLVVCPNCHRLIHMGMLDEEKIKL